MASLEDQIAAAQLLLSALHNQRELQRNQAQHQAEAQAELQPDAQAADPNIPAPPPPDPAPAVSVLAPVVLAAPASSKTHSAAPSLKNLANSTTTTPRPKPKSTPKYPAPWRTFSSDNVIGWTRKNGCKNPTKYGIAVHSNMTEENCEVLRNCGQRFPKTEGGVCEKGKDEENKKDKKKGKEKMELVLEDGQVFFYSKFVRDGGEGNGAVW